MKVSTVGGEGSGRAEGGIVADERWGEGKGRGDGGARSFVGGGGKGKGQQRGEEIRRR